MPQYTQDQMCTECPFRATAARGWLGPWTVEDFEKWLAFDNAFICHTDVGRLLKRGLTEEEINDAGQHCVGFLRYKSQQGSRSRDSECAAAQERLKGIPDLPILPKWGFRPHHELKRQLFLVQCDQCGRDWQAHSRRPLYCPACKRQRRREQRRASRLRQRQGDK